MQHSTVSCCFRLTFRLNVGMKEWKDSLGMWPTALRTYHMAGHNVYPSDIETVISEHPAVQLSAVIGVPDDKVGEEVAAIVMLKPGAYATGEAITDFVKERVASYNYPRIVRIVDDLPLGPTGKVLKRAIDLSSVSRTRQS